MKRGEDRKPTGVQRIKKDKGCEAGPEELMYKGVSKRGKDELIGLTWWAA